MHFTFSIFSDELDGEEFQTSEPQLSDGLDQSNDIKDDDLDNEKQKRRQSRQLERRRSSQFLSAAQFPPEHAPAVAVYDLSSSND